MGWGERNREDPSQAYNRGFREGREHERAIQAAAELEQKLLGPFGRESETSRKAAIDAYPRQGSQRWRVLDVIDGAAQLGELGLTREQVEGRTGLSGNTVRPRVKELLDGGFIEESTLTRPTRHGSAASVLVVTNKGAMALERWA